MPEEVSALDHILMSSNLAFEVSQVYYGTGMFKMDCDSHYSDHFPLMATIPAVGRGNSRNRFVSSIFGGLQTLQA